MNYYMAIGSQQKGPFPAEQLLSRGLRPETLVWREGMAEWKPAEEVPELGFLLRRPEETVPPPPPAPMGPPSYGPGGGYGNAGHGGYAVPEFTGGVPMTRAEVNNKKIAAGICGILLGGFGVHKFILGFTGPGLILLLLTFATCGFLGIVTGVIGLIEGIIYLTKTDEEFYRRYVVEKQGWF